MAKLMVTATKGEVIHKLAEGSRKAMAEMLSLPWDGATVGGSDGYKAAKSLLVDMYCELEIAARKSGKYPVNSLMDFHDSDYLISLYQGMDIAGIFNRFSASMAPSLRAWFVIAFYAYWYEFAAKQLVSFTRALTEKEHTKAGEVVNLLVENYKLTDLKDYFDYHLRNAINHSQYIMTDLQASTIQAWDVKDGVKQPARAYLVDDIFKMTIKLLFFTIAYHNQWYELVIYVDEQKLVK